MSRNGRATTDGERSGTVSSPYFTEEHEALRRTIRRFVEKELQPHADRWEEEGEFPSEVFRRLGELGFLGLRYPEEYGGQGGDYFAAIVLAEELARCRAPGLMLAVEVQTEMA
ncbi:MAG: acyl-CoA dehydrogenase family protein, partial [Firmicutes bacterium]|nr:acyl-CoA dehydrogenase family protein [Bacillota bacterium]